MDILEETLYYTGKIIKEAKKLYSYEFIHK